jgi:hypothetical protein
MPEFTSGHNDTSPRDGAYGGFSTVGDQAEHGLHQLLSKKDARPSHLMAKVKDVVEHPELFDKLYDRSVDAAGERTRPYVDVFEGEKYLAFASEEEPQYGVLLE